LRSFKEERLKNKYNDEALKLSLSQNNKSSRKPAIALQPHKIKSNSSTAFKNIQNIKISKIPNGPKRNTRAVSPNWNQRDSGWQLMAFTAPNPKANSISRKRCEIVQKDYIESDSKCVIDEFSRLL